jgi:cellobiose phosphorylase
MYEVSPDFGMMTQAWNIYALAVPIVSYYFGIQPNAAKEQIVIQPNLPSSWKEVGMENIKVGENVISVQVENGSIEISQTQDWKIIFIDEDGSSRETNQNTTKYTL